MQLGKHKHELNWLKQAIESNPEKPDSNLWNKIDQDLYLEESWTVVSGQLEVENLWPTVAKRLNRVESLAKIEKIGSVATYAIVLLCLLFAPVYNAIRVNYKENLVVENTLEEGYDALHVKKALSKDLNRLDKAQSDNTNIKTLYGLYGNKIAQQPTVNSSIKFYKKRGRDYRYTPINAEFLPAITADIRLVSDVNIRAVVKPVVQVYIEDVPVNEDAPVAVVSSKKSNPKLVAFGLTGAAKMGWMMNDKSREALSTNSLISTRPGISSNLGFLAELSQNPRLNWIAEIKWNRWRQDYSEYKDGFIGDTYYFMNGYRANMLASYKISKSRQWRAIGGLALSYTKETFEQRNNRKEFLNNIHQPLSLGAVFGYEYVKTINQVWAVGYGLRLYTDLTDMYKPNYRNTYGLAPFKRSSIDVVLTVRHNISVSR